LKSYFFVPGNRPEFLKNISELKADHFIIDLEDSINEKEIGISLENARNTDGFRNFYFRLSFNPQRPADQLQYIASLINDGVTRFVIPKIENTNQLNDIICFLQKHISDPTLLRFIVLIESPKALVCLRDILEIPSVCAIGLGSHDYCQQMRMEHTEQNLLWPRMYILNYGKAFNKEIIDIASMNIGDEELFEAECQRAISAGFNGKFIIHPNQLRILNSMELYSDKELSTALKVRDYIKSLGGINFFTLANFEGEVVEKTHLDRLRKILKMSGNETF
jgi:citrate lyase beta subunit